MPKRTAAVLRTIAARSLAEIEDALIKDRLNALAWLAAAGFLEIELALRIGTRDVRALSRDSVGPEIDRHSQR